MQKAHKTLLQIIETAAVILQMIRINIRYHRNHRLQKQKRRIRLIRLRDQILAVAQARITARRREHPADDKRRIQPGIGEDGGDQTRRRRLAVRTRDRNPETETHQLGQHLGAADDRNPQLARAQHFRIGGVDSRRRDHHRRITHILRTVAEKHRGALCLQTLRIGGRLQIRTAHRITQRNQHLSDGTHANPADADKKHITHTAHLAAFNPPKMNISTHLKNLNLKSELKTNPAKRDNHAKKRGEGQGGEAPRQRKKSEHNKN